MKFSKDTKYNKKDFGNIASDRTSGKKSSSIISYSTTLSGASDEERINLFKRLGRSRYARTVRVKVNRAATLRIKYRDEDQFVEWGEGLTANKPFDFKSKDVLIEEIELQNSTANTTYTIFFSDAVVDLREEQNVSVGSPLSVGTPSTVTITASAQAITTTTTDSVAMLIADSGNAGVISVGDSSAQVPMLYPTDSFVSPEIDPSDIYVKGTASDTLYVILFSG